jgi:peptide/nickel transport system ATP-binding protein
MTTPDLVAAMPPTPAAAVRAEPDALVVVEHLVKHYRSDRAQVVRAVDDVSFTIRRGETFGLVGESGSGKSTVARTILRLHEPTAGRVTFDGVDLASLGPSELRRQRRSMQIVFQDPFASVNRRKTLSEIIAGPMIFQGERDGAKVRARVSRLFDIVGLPQAYAHRHPHEISGGQCQRVGIARALALEPSFVILDEAVSSLDVSVRSQILNLLRQLQRDLGLTYMFVSHDLAIVRYMSNSLAVMYGGRIVEDGPRAELFERPQHPYTHALMGAIPVPDPDRERARKRVLSVDTTGQLINLVGCRYQPRCPIGRSLDVCRTVDPTLTSVGERHAVACHFPQSAESIVAAADEAQVAGEPDAAGEPQAAGESQAAGEPQAAAGDP